MSAYSRPFKTTCGESGCSSRASCEVFNTYNSKQGVFCRKHAARRVKALRVGERPPIPYDVAQARLREANDVRIQQLEGGA